MRSRSAVVAVVALAAAAAAAACGGSDDSVSTTATTLATPTTSAPAVTTTAASASANCQPADEEVASIAEGMKDGAVVRNAFAVPLEPPVGNYRLVVAAEIDGGGAPAGDGQVGAWGTGPGGSGVLFALDATAQRFSSWGEVAGEGSPADRMRDQVAARPEVATAKACVTG